MLIKAILVGPWNYCDINGKNLIFVTYQGAKFSFRALNTWISCQTLKAGTVQC